MKKTPSKKLSLIKGEDKKAGKTISGSCKDGDEVEVKDDHGVPVLSLKGK